MGLFDRNKEKDEDLKRRNPDNLPTKFQVIVRMIVGVYLCYIVFKLISDGALVKTQGIEKIIMIAPCIFGSLRSIIVREVIDWHFNIGLPFRHVAFVFIC